MSSIHQSSRCPEESSTQHEWPVGTHGEDALRRSSKVPGPQPMPGLQGRNLRPRWLLHTASLGHCGVRWSNVHPLFTKACYAWKTLTFSTAITTKWGKTYWDTESLKSQNWPTSIWIPTCLIRNHPHVCSLHLAWAKSLSSTIAEGRR